ncbi:otoconin-90-like [Rhea pennata]|uniref:otoconin-90-like n=1 Tax=Rhea pennata TaxID=8795 RepID=UPI002E256C0C
MRQRWCNGIAQEGNLLLQQRARRSRPEMKNLLLFAVLLVCEPPPARGSVLELKRMVKSTTGRSALLSYSWYGCFCGIGGRGTPVDATDRCCHAHDCCYRKLRESNCRPLITPYEFNVTDGDVACADELTQGRQRRDAARCGKALADPAGNADLLSPRRAVAKMNCLLALAVLFASGTVTAQGNLWDLQRMITKATGRSAVLHYSSYGCHCGWGGRGQPKDATDGCCQQHDACYDSLLRHSCDAKKERYRHGWRGGSPVCARASWCAQLSCECDRSLALCLRRSLGTYRARYRFYPRYRCEQ